MERSTQFERVSRLKPASLHEDVLYDAAIHVGEAIVAARMTERHLGVVEAEQVQDGGVELGHSDLVFGDVVAEFVGLPARRAAADPSTRSSSAI
jgi:hypothetical protein